MTASIPRILFLALLLTVLALGLIYPIVYLVEHPLAQPWHALTVGAMLGVLGIASMAVGVVLGRLQVERLRMRLKN